MTYVRPIVTDAPPKAQDKVGWICPACGQGVAPSEKTCDHQASLSKKESPLNPTYYDWEKLYKLPGDIPTYNPGPSYVAPSPTWTTNNTAPTGMR